LFWILSNDDCRCPCHGGSRSRSAFQRDCVRFRLHSGGHCGCSIAVFLGNEFQAPIDVCHLIPEAGEDNPGSVGIWRRSIAKHFGRCFPMQAQIGRAIPFTWTAAWKRAKLSTVLKSKRRIDRSRSTHRVSLGRHVHTSLPYQLLAKVTVRSFHSAANPGRLMTAPSPSMPRSCSLRSLVSRRGSI